MISAYFFDFDGTLFDTDEANARSYDMAFREAGYSLSYDDYVTRCAGRSYQAFIPELTGCTDPEAVTRIHNDKKKFYRENYSLVRPNPLVLGSAVTLSEHFLCAVVTTADRQSVEDLLRKYNAASYFRFIIAGNDVKNAKPDPECYLAAISRSGFRPEETAAYEDNRVGYLAARAAGIRDIRMVRHGVPDVPLP